ncbi:DNA primase [Aestuariibacter salexigens]|uniref:DNA primase n=1 Tax=Aestuariibacter salexigens TaxID=226010 RepID=UPI00041CB34D|nr:DNA primase [Aestuariibacter salexigens]
MAGRIPRDFIDDLLTRTDIVEVVDSRVKLKKAGKNYQACCPFHNEKSPSFTVSQDKQFYHCFGCGAHGNAISFIMEFDRLEFPEAIEELARSMGLEVPREQGRSSGPTPQQRQQKEDDYMLMEKAARFFQHQLSQHPQRQRVVDYLKNRGLSGEIVKAWNIGYAPPEWDGLLSAFGQNASQRQQLLDLKLINQNDKGRTYDFFRDRVMFPIRDKRGRVIGFGGRIIDGDGPKYLNSPETRIFHKGQELYGFYQARQQNRSLQRLVIVEGYMDVVALSQQGIHYSVASLGTATTAEHMQMLFRAAPQIVCCYDGDNAGREAAWRALNAALPYLKDGVEMKFLFLPDGEDPDSLVRKEGKDALEARFADAMPLSKFLFTNLLERHHVSSVEGKAALKAEAQPLIDQIGADNQRDQLMQELAKHLGEQDKYQLERDMAQAESRAGKPRQDYSKPAKATVSPIRTMIRLLIDQPSLAGRCEDVQPELLSQAALPGLDLLLDVHRYCLQHPQANTARLLESFREHPHIHHLSKLMTQEHLIDSTLYEKVYQDSFAKLLDWLLIGRMEELLSRSRLGPLSSEEKQELNLLMKAHNK